MNKVRLGRIGTIVTGKTPSTKDVAYYSSDDYMFIVPEDITNNPSSIERSIRYISDAGLNSIKSNTIEGQSILIGCIGSDMGNVGFTSHKCATNQQINSLTRINSNYNAKYIYYVIRQMKDYLRKVSGGSTTPILPKSFLENLEICVQELPIQKAIASFLSALDDKIALNNKINAELEQTARLIYDYWFTQFDFPDATGKPYKSSGGAMVMNDQLKRKIPTDWKALKLQDVLTFEKGTEPGASAYSNEQNSKFDRAFYRVSDIDGVTKTFVNSSRTNLKIVKPNDIVVTFDGSVGKVGIGLNGAISGGLRHIYDKTGSIKSAGVYAIFSNNYIIKTIEKYSTGSIILHASSSIGYLYTPFEDHVFDSFQKIIEPMFAKIITNRREAQRLAKLRDWLLPMLMNGQVSVKS